MANVPGCSPSPCFKSNSHGLLFTARAECGLHTVLWAPPNYLHPLGKGSCCSLSLEERLQERPGKQLQSSSLTRPNVPCNPPGRRSLAGAKRLQEHMASHCRNIRNTLQDFTERLTSSASAALSDFLAARRTFSTTRQPGSAFTDVRSDWSPVSSETAFSCTGLTQGHQSRC